MSRSKMGVFTLTMINISTILSVRNWPFTAEYGLASIVYLILATLLYFVPIALISAELASGWPKKGGLYAWITEAFGKKAGFVTVFLLWLSNVVWYPTILSFVTATLAYAIDPRLAENSLFQFFSILTVFWAIMLFNFRGIRFSSGLSTWGVILGTLLPGTLLIAFSFAWWLGGDTVQIPLTLEACIPQFTGVDDLVFIAGVLLGFAGMEMTAVHVQDVDSPRKNYPRAIFYSASLIVLLTLLGTLAVAVVIPKENIGLVTACLESLKIYLERYGMGFALPLVAILVAFGSIGGISTWLAGPSKGLHAACEELNLSAFFTKTKKGMPVNIMLLQGTIVSIITALFLVMPSVNSSFWVLTVLSSQMYLVVYFFLFLAGITLKYTRPSVQRGYAVPGKTLGMWVIAALGLLNTAFCFTIGFIPPSQLETGSTFWYMVCIGLGTAASVIVPYVIIDRSIRRKTAQAELV